MSFLTLITLTFLQLASASKSDSLRLITPAYPKETPTIIKLLDNDSNIVNQWKIPFRVFHSQLGNDGYLYVAAHDGPIKDTVVSGENNLLLKVNRSGKIVDKFVFKYKHHSFSLIQDEKKVDQIAFIESYPIKPEKLPSLNLKSSDFKYGSIFFDRFVVFDLRKKKVVWSWESHKYLNKAEYLPIRRKGDVLHSNSIQYLEKDPINNEKAILFHARSSRRAFLISLKTKDIIWKSSNILYEVGHDAQIMGKDLYVFANASENNFASKVIKIDMKTHKASSLIEGVGDYNEPDQFFSMYMSGFQLLENGNYLVTLGVSGMVMEMTPDKKVLWRFFDKKVVKEGLPDTNLWPYQSIFKANAYPKMW